MMRTFMLGVAVLLALWAVCCSQNNSSGSRGNPRLRKQTLLRARLNKEGPTLHTQSDASSLNQGGSSAGAVHDAAGTFSSASTSGTNRRPEMLQQDESATPLKRGQSRGVLQSRKVTQVRSPGQLAMVQDESTSGSRSRLARVPSGSGSPNLLASFAGKNRVIVISAPHASEGYYRLMISLLKPDVYCELADRHIEQIVMFHEDGEVGGKVRRITNEGKINEEPLDPALVPKLMNFLKLEKGKFGMVLLRKTLQVEERYPYPLITVPHEENDMYVQQRDEYLEHVCEMAIRKISIITIFGSLTNSTMKIDHYQLENEKAMRGLKEDDLLDQDLIIELRKEYGMTYNEFFMVMTDFDMKVKQYYEVPIAMKAVFDYIDIFQSRIKEMERQKKEGISCLRHIAVLKLVGVDLEAGGVLELFPINGSATVDREGLSLSLVKDIRNYFQISPEYFSMLLVGKDGNVKSWYPSPMGSMAIIYDLLDSMQLRRQEMAIQQSLGMRCPEDEYGGYGYHHGYEEGYQDDHHHHYR
ncbi:UNVERIFIED_CONTAM: hypothetical protein FKN15_040413 [Acipenser sinensis]